MNENELYYLSLFKEHLKYLYDDISMIEELIKEMQEDIENEKRNQKTERTN